MTRPISILLIALAVPLVAGGLYVSVPMLTEASSVVQVEADEHVERARRLLHTYNENIERLASVLNTLEKQGVEVRRERLISENETVLKDALKAVGDALSVSHGDASAGQHAQAQQIKGTILVAQADLLRRKADIVRNQCEKPRAQLVTLAKRVRTLEQEANVVEQSGIHANIEVLNDQAAEVQATLTARKRAIAELESTVADLEAKLADATRRSESARAQLDQLEHDGADLLDPHGAEKFAEAYTLAANAYHSAISDAHRFEHGSLENARIDDSGDYIKGGFVPEDASGEIVGLRGLMDHRRDLEVARHDRDGLMQTLDEVEQSARSLSELAQYYAQKALDAKEHASEALGSATNIFAKYQAFELEAEDMLDQSLAKARSAVAAFRTASGSATTRTRDAGDALNVLSAPAQERSATKLQAEERWIVGQLSADGAHARMVLASILFDRFMAADSAADLIAAVKSPLVLAQANADEFKERRDEAKTEGADALREAVANYEKAYRDVNNNWTVPASVATAHDMLRVLENPVHVQTAIVNYENAIQGRESEAVTRVFMDRIEQLRSR